jgi:hypothetical protein
VAGKDLVPGMMHFVLEHGTIRSYNGVMALGARTDLDIRCAPKAVQLVQAIDRCREELVLTLTPTERLHVASGHFHAYVPCLPLEDMPHVVPSGDTIDLDGEALLTALRVLEPFIGNDATRIWSNGILLRGSSAFATNNVVLLEYWVGQNIPFDICIPHSAVKEMLRAKAAPKYVQGDARSITCHYEDGRWLYTQLLSTEWPDIARILDSPVQPEDLPTVPGELWDRLQDLVPFLENTSAVHFRNGSAYTAQTDEEGARCVLPPDAPVAGTYNLRMLLLLADVAQRLQLVDSGTASVFYGERLRGAIVGHRN